MHCSLPLTSVLTQGQPRGLYLPAPSQFLVGLCCWKHQAGAGRQGTEGDEVPPSVVTEGWPRPLDEGGESCLGARLVLVLGTTPSPPRSGMGTLLCSPGHCTSLGLPYPDPLFRWSSAISSLDTVSQKCALCPLPRLSDMCLRLCPPPS